MNTTTHRSSVWAALLAAVACSLVVVGVLWAPAPAAQADLPPRPTAQAQPQAPSRPPVGAQIELRVQFPADWPWASAHWQDLWTVVQWQDAGGDWHAVEGWQGGLDGVSVDDAGTVTGHKTWWVAEEDFDSGPFRWVIAQSKDGAPLAASAPFDLPSVNRATATVTVPLGE
jgi:hypothetical protein